MAGWGGRRPGAGAPAGGISQARRLILRALQRGLTYAGQARGLRGPEEEVAVESAARIASDMILAGRGAEVLALYIAAAPKADDSGGGDDAKSPLLRALERLPGMGAVPAQSIGKEAAAERDGNIADNPAPATDQVSVAPFFHPQTLLIPPHLEPSLPGDLVVADGACVGSEARAACDQPAAHPAATPYPRGGGSPILSCLSTENFEKNPENGEVA